MLHLLVIIGLPLTCINCKRKWLGFRNRRPLNTDAFLTSVKLLRSPFYQVWLGEGSWLQKHCYILCTYLEDNIITYSLVSVNKNKEWPEFRPINILYSNEGMWKLPTSLRTEQPVCSKSYIFTKEFVSSCMLLLFLKTFESRCICISTYKQQK